MTEPELKKLYESAAGFEDRADADAEAKRLEDYIATYCQCRAGHHRPRSQERCECGQLTSMIVTGYPS
jgi:hypothetical protein